MRSLANTRVVIENTVTLDEYGEAVGGGDNVIGPIPASLVERTQIIPNANDLSAPAVVEYATLRVKYGTPLAIGQIVSDLKGNKRWKIEQVTELSNPMVRMDLKAHLVRASS